MTGGAATEASAPGAGTLLPTASAAQTRRTVGRLLRQRLRLLVGTATVLVVGTACGLAVPALLGRLVDVVDDGATDQLDGVVLALVAASVAHGVLSGWGLLLVARLGEKTLASLRQQVVERAVTVPLEQVEAAGTGDLVARIGGDVDAVSTATREAVPELVMSLLTIGLTAVGMAALDWRLGLAGLAGAPVDALGARWYLRRSSPLYAAERAAEGERAQQLHASVAGASTVRTFRLVRRHVDLVTDRSERALTWSLRAGSLRAWFFTRVNGAELVGLATILVTGFFLVRADEATVGEATAAALYFHRLFDPIGALLMLLDTAQSATAALARLVGVADLPPPDPAASPTDLATDPSPDDSPHAAARVRDPLKSRQADPPRRGRPNGAAGSPRSSQDQPDRRPAARPASGAPAGVDGGDAPVAESSQHGSLHAESLSGPPTDSGPGDEPMEHRQRDGSLPASDRDRVADGVLVTGQGLGCERAGGGGDVVVEGVRFGYVEGREVLHGIDLRVAPGELVAVVGASGAGKSTLAKLIAGVHRPSAGRLRIGGMAVGDEDPSALRRAVVLVTQEVHVFAGPLAEDLRLAQPDADDATLREALAHVGALDWVDALPDGLDTVVGEGGRRLGTTEAQQLALARLVLADPAVAVLDEATAEAGSAGARRLEASARAALEGRTALVVAHRLTQAASADRIVVLDRGRIVEQGTHDELAHAEGPYAQLWSAWSAVR